MEKKLIAISWALTYDYLLLSTAKQQIKAGGQGNKSATTPVTQAAINLPVIQAVTKPDNKPKPTAEPKSKTKPLIVTTAK